VYLEAARPRHLSDIIRENARRVHHQRRLYLAAVGDHRLHMAVFHPYAGHLVLRQSLAPLETAFSAKAMVNL